MATNTRVGRWGFGLALAGLLVTGVALADGKTDGEQPAEAAAAAAAEGAAAPAPSEEEQEKAAQEAFMKSLSPQSGKVPLQGDLATLTIPQDFAYLNAAETERVLTQAWGNPPGSEALGMIYPRATGLFGDASWGVIITYTEDGYVEDDEAEDLDYDDLLKDMQEGTTEANAERTKAGYPAMQLLGWAEPPHYDKGTHKIYWAKELQVEGAPEKTLNYAVRVLGRKGVLELNAIAVMPQLPVIKSEMPKVIGFVEFNAGSRYEDFDDSTDKVAAYGIGALVAGKMAAKVGLFKGLIALLIAGKKLVIFGVIALFAALKGLFSRNKGEPAQAEAESKDDDDNANAA
jgi:uncharacterized membrane-anchored protein